MAENKTFNLLDKYNHVWVKQGDDNVYVSPYWEQATGLVSAEVLNENTILLGFTMTDGLTADALKDALAINDADGAEVTIESVEITGATSVKVTAEFDLDKLPLSVHMQAEQFPLLQAGECLMICMLMMEMTLVQLTRMAKQH